MQNKKNEPTWKWIKHRLDRLGLSFNKLASMHNVHFSCFTGLKNKPCPKFERLLSDALGIDPWDLWPDRYDEAHNPNRVSSRYQGHKSFVEHASKEINGKDSKDK